MYSLRASLKVSQRNNQLLLVLLVAKSDRESAARKGVQVEPSARLHTHTHTHFDPLFVVCRAHLLSLLSMMRQ